MNYRIISFHKKIFYMFIYEIIENIETINKIKKKDIKKKKK